jgi:cell division protein FtsB
MLQKAKELARKYWPYIYELQDIRVAGLVIFGIIVLLISWSGVKAIDTNYQLQRQIVRLQQQDKLAKLDNSNTALENDYYKTNQFLELSARQNLGLAQPGETELSVPKDIALRYAAAVPKTSTAAIKASNKQPTYQKNLQAWVNFFLHRPQTDV